MSNISDEALALFFEDITLFDINAKKEATSPIKRIKKEKVTDLSFKNTFMVFPAIDEVAKNKNYQLFYSNILKAIRLDPSKVTMVNSSEVDINTLNENDLIICWGTPSAENTPEYVATRLSNNVLQLMIDPIEQLSTDTALKSKLWLQLKMLYNV